MLIRTAHAQTHVLSRRALRSDLRREGGVSQITVMYQRHKLLKRLTLTFLFISVGLWIIRIVQIYWNPCKNHEAVRKIAEIFNGPAKKGVEQLGLPAAQNISLWFEDGIHKASGRQSTVQSVCNATIGNHLKKHITQSDNPSYFATLTGIGELHLKLQGTGPDHKLVPNAAELLSGILPYVRGSDGMFTSLASAVSSSEGASVTVLSSLGDIGVSLVSLASEPISQQAAANTESVRQTARALEAAELTWFGLNAKKHHVMTVNGQRVGFVAFCAVHGLCVESAQLPFGPVKYHSKLATLIINELKVHGVSLIIVLVYWGWRTSSFPDEMALPVARHLASLGVDVIVGYHPNGVQDHAYMGKTLILFSLGHVLSSDHVVSYCWNKVSNKWQYSRDKECQQVQPAARDGLMERETHTRIYKIHISNSVPAVAEYVTLPMTYYEHGKIRRPFNTISNIENGQNWTTVCGEKDTHCLSCVHF